MLNAFEWAASMPIEISSLRLQFGEARWRRAGSSAAPDNYAIFALGHITHFGDQCLDGTGHSAPILPPVALAPSPWRAHEARWGCGSLKQAIVPTDRGRTPSAASPLGVGVGRPLPPRLRRFWSWRRGRPYIDTGVRYWGGLLTSVFMELLTEAVQESLPG